MLTTIELTPSSDLVLQQVPNARPKFHNYSVAEAQQSGLSTAGLELTELANKKRMSLETLAVLDHPFAQYYSSISSATSAVFPSYRPTRI